MHFHEMRVSEFEDGTRLDRIIRKQGITQAIIEKSLRKGLIKVGGLLVPTNYRLKEGDIITIDDSIKIDPPAITIPQVDLKLLKQLQESILYKDANIIVLNKANNIAVQGGSKIKHSIDCMLDHLCFELKMRPKLVHRLDKDTSGVLLIARHGKAAAILAEHFKNKNIEKQYIAVIVGTPKKHSGKIISIIDNNEALTHYKILGSINNDLSIISLSPITGKKHQLRIHCEQLGHPILGDDKYGVKSKKPLHLHAYKISLNSFMNNKHMEFTAPLPLYIKNLCELAGVKI